MDHQYNTTDVVNAMAADSFGGTLAAVDIACNSNFDNQYDNDVCDGYDCDTGE